MTHPDLGGGIGLDSDFDLKLDNTGDIAGEFDDNELFKDLAYALNRSLNTELNTTVDEDLFADVRIATRRTLLRDERIESDDIENVEVKADPDNNDRLLVLISVSVADNESVDGVVELDTS